VVVMVMSMERDRAGRLRLRFEGVRVMRNAV